MCTSFLLQVKLTLLQRDQQLEALQQEHLDLMKQLTLTQEGLQSREQSLDALQTQYDELQARLGELQGEAASREDTICLLQNEKIILEAALQAAKSGKEELDQGARRLGEGTEETAETLEKLREELAVKSSQVEHLQQETAALKKQTQKIKEQFIQQKVMVEAYRRDTTSKDQLISELKATRKRLDSELKELRQELIHVQGEKRAAEAELSRLHREASQAQQQMADLEGHLRAAQKERDEMETHLQVCQCQTDSLTGEDSAKALGGPLCLGRGGGKSLQFDKDQMVAVTEANEALKKQIEELQQEARKAITEQKQKMRRLGSDLTSAQKEMKSKHKAYESAVGILSRRLQEALVAKEAADAELGQLRAQGGSTDGSPALQERIQALEAELQTVGHSKMLLEKELQEVIALTSQELEESREKVLELEDEWLGKGSVPGQTSIEAHGPGEGRALGYEEEGEGPGEAADHDHNSFQIMKQAWLCDLQESRGFRKKIKRLEESNKKLALELEHEKGKLTGLGQSNTALREHNSVLETALAKREADLVQLNLQVQAVLQRKEEEDRQMKQLVQTLQASLEKEKEKVNSLKEQVFTVTLVRLSAEAHLTFTCPVRACSSIRTLLAGHLPMPGTEHACHVAAAKVEAGHNRRHFKAASLELSEVKKELQAKEHLVQKLQAEADGLQIREGKHSQEIAQFQAELAEARAQLQLLQKQLDEQLNKQPVGNQEMEDLKWEVDRKEREIQSLKQQLDLTEQQGRKELEGLQQLLQVPACKALAQWEQHLPRRPLVPALCGLRPGDALGSPAPSRSHLVHIMRQDRGRAGPAPTPWLHRNVKSELELAQEDLSMTQKDKFMLQAKVSELKNNMKTLLQQNQQLKLDLRRGTAKTRKEPKGEASSSSPATPIKIPDCPVPASLLEELLRPPPAVSKEPLKNLNSCLQQLNVENSATDAELLWPRLVCGSLKVPMSTQMLASKGTSGQEMDSLQRQMEEHTLTVHESLSSWTQVEGRLAEPATASPAPPGDHANPQGDTQRHSQSRVSKEGPGQ
ncbi:Golgin sub A member 3 [Saguinus oedipus]|uniref:Golgin sub A member 3 n=1 Tax=Saguinus oedipus TaxID=9490 RepID=A0ABQ9V0X5_SAGOE|nr:Golgin sub A member 3 [Saguinus oedipus]